MTLKTTKTPTKEAPGAQRDTESSRTIIVRLDPETHKALRIRVAEEDTSIQQWIESLVERELGIKETSKPA
jgi:predicted HicB family RNase H-like nuclease